MLRDLGHEVSAVAVAAMYSDFLDVFVLDEVDASMEAQISSLSMKGVITNTVMNSLEDKQCLARTVLQLVEDSRAERRARDFLMMSKG